MILLPIGGYLIVRLAEVVLESAASAGQKYLAVCKASVEAKEKEKA